MHFHKSLKILTFRFFMNFLSLKKNLKKDFSSFKRVKIALMGDSATQFIVQAIKGYGYEVNIDCEILEADYGQIERQILDPSSELYKFSPEYIVIFHSSQKLVKKFYELETQGKSVFAEDQISNIQLLYETVNSNMPSCKLIFSNFIEVIDSVFGNYSNKLNISFNYQLKKINYELMNLACSNSNLFINDMSSLNNKFGFDMTFDPKMYVHADMVFSLDFLPYVAKNTVEIVRSISGDIKKCIVLDLDNTIWGGIIGEDGLNNIELGDLGIGKAFIEFQKWILQLKKRGIILAVCSKNDDIVAKEPFEKHPDMVLKLDDIAVFVANWENKAVNIKYIQSVLNIGFDSMIFIDDSVFERNIVREYLPEVTVPEMPEDPAEYLVFLRNLNLFEAASFSSNDADREP